MCVRQRFCCVPRTPTTTATRPPAIPVCLFSTASRREQSRGQKNVTDTEAAGGPGTEKGRTTRTTTHMRRGAGSRVQSHTIHGQQNQHTRAPHMGRGLPGGVLTLVCGGCGLAGRWLCVYCPLPRLVPRLAGEADEPAAAPAPVAVEATAASAAGLTTSLVPNRRSPTSPMPGNTDCWG